MNQCGCGRPLFDGMRVCEYCQDLTEDSESAYHDRQNLESLMSSGYERTKLRRKMANRGRGYEQ